MTFLLPPGIKGLKRHSWWLTSYDYVGAEQLLEALNAHEKDLLCEYHYRLFKCFESAQRTTSADLFVRLSKRRIAHIQIFWLRNLYPILDHGKICVIEISQSFTW